MRTLLYTLPIWVVSACTDYSNAFDCPPKPGMGCKSISDIHGHIVEHERGDDALPVTTDDASSDCVNGSCSGLKVSRDLGVLDVSAPAGYLVSAGSDLVHRVPERVIRIWVNGQVNAAGDYEAAHYVYVALKDDGWKRLKQEGIIRDED